MFFWPRSRIIWQHMCLFTVWEHRMFGFGTVSFRLSVMPSVQWGAQFSSPCSWGFWMVRPEWFLFVCLRYELRETTKQFLHIFFKCTTPEFMQVHISGNVYDSVLWNTDLCVFLWLYVGLWWCILFIKLSLLYIDPIWLLTERSACRVDQISGAYGWWGERTSFLTSLPSCRTENYVPGLHLLTFQHPRNHSQPDKVLQDSMSFHLSFILGTFTT